MNLVLNMQKLGTIVALPDSPSTTQFSFVLDKNAQVKKGQYVQTGDSGTLTIGYINEITKANRYFERAESVSEFERHREMKDVFPVGEWEYTLGEVKIVGSWSNGAFQRTYTPPPPGNKIVPADEELLKKVKIHLLIG